MTVDHHISAVRVGRGNRSDRSLPQWPAWMDRAACQGLPLEQFFPDSGMSAEDARRVCLRCPVRDACRDFAARMRIDHGVWGGLSPLERRPPKQAAVVRRSVSRERNPELAARDAEIARLTSEGRSRPEIARLLGVSTSAVARSRNWAKKASS